MSTKLSANAKEFVPKFLMQPTPAPQPVSESVPQSEPQATTEPNPQPASEQEQPAPIESQPAESQPAETQPLVETQPAPVESQPAPVESQPAETSQPEPSQGTTESTQQPTETKQAAHNSEWQRGNSVGSPSNDTWTRGQQIVAAPTVNPSSDAVDPLESVIEENDPIQRYTATFMLTLRTKFTDIPKGLSISSPLFHSFAQKDGNSNSFKLKTPRGGGVEFRRPKRATVYEKPKWAEYDPNDKKEEVLRQARLILNKLTVEKFDRLSGEFVKCNFVTEDMLSGAIDIIVDKAQTEHHFGAMYADLCKRLAESPMTKHLDEEAEEAYRNDPENNQDRVDKHGKSYIFKTILLRVCQREFEKDQNELKKECEALSEDERDEKLMMIKKRYLGHMKFVGHLYHVSLLRESVLLFCIDELLAPPPDEDRLQCLGTLITTVGKQLQHGKKKGKETFVRTMQRVEEFSTDKSLSSRIRFMFRDLIDLKNAGWESRRPEEKAKTIKEIHNDAQREARTPTSSGGTPRSQQPGSQDVRIQKKERPQADAEGFVMVSGSGARPRKNVKPAAAPVRVSTQSSFAILASSKKDKDKKDKSKKDKEKKKDKKDSKSSDRKVPPPVVTELPPPTPSVSLETFKNTVRGEIDEYFNSKDATEVIESVKEMNSPDHHMHIVDVAIGCVYKNSKLESAELGCALLTRMHAEGFLSSQEASRGFVHKLSSLEDDKIDVPRAPDLLKLLLTPLLVSDLVSLTCLKDVDPEVFEMDEFMGYLPKFIVALLKNVQETSCLEKAHSLLTDSGLDLRALAKNDELLDAALRESDFTLP